MREFLQSLGCCAARVFSDRLLFRAGTLLGVAGWMLVPAVSVAQTPQTALRVEQVNPQSHPFEQFQCGQSTLQVRNLGQALEVVFKGESRMLLPAVAASGARYQAPGDPETEFWGKGPRATVTWSGQQLPTCVMPGAVALPFKASGNEPFWSITYDGWVLTLQQPGRSPLVRDASISESSPAGFLLDAGKALQMRVRSNQCVDTMTGMTYPETVSLDYEGQQLQGCGGDPLRLLQGAQWQVLRMAGKAFSDDQAAWLSFLPENRLAGNSGCNRFMGSYQLSAEGLSFHGLAGTRMACSPQQMTTESRLLNLLSQVRGFSIASDGTLVLKTDDDASAIELSQEQ